MHTIHSNVLEDICYERYDKIWIEVDETTHTYSYKIAISERLVDCNKMDFRVQ